MSIPTPLLIGWAEGDITPVTLPAFIAGQFHMRLSEGVDDPLKVTALALENGEDQVIFAGCDLVVIPDELREAVRALLATAEFDANKIIFNATHTHTGPEIRVRTTKSDLSASDGCGVHLEGASIQDYLDFAAQTIADTVAQAWATRRPGGIAYGQGDAVLAHNRRWFNTEGKATMYGLHEGTADTFSHVEGYEDHSVNLLATYNQAGALTGLLVNVPCPSQVREMEFVISADYWHDTRQLLRAKWGENLFILPQCSAAGDQAPRPIFEREANQRMQRLRGENGRQEIARLIADVVERVLPVIESEKQNVLELQHQVTTLNLPAIPLTEQHVAQALEEAQNWRKLYKEEVHKLEESPELKQEPRWYVPITKAFRRMNWYANVETRFHDQVNSPTVATEIHVVRLGEIAFASVPFEYYLDFGIRIKVKSPAQQTFLVQLSGGGTYVPSERSVAGGGYGSIPASNPIGPDGGNEMAQYIVDTLREQFERQIS